MSAGTSVRARVRAYHRPKGPQALVWRLVAVVVLFSYNTWVWIAPVNGHVLIMNGYLSELSASDQPHNLFFRFGDALTALLVMIIGIAALRRWPASARVLAASRRAQRWWRLSALFLLLFALATGLDAISSMDCSPTLSATCAAAEKAGTLSWAHYLHTFTSVGAQIGICGSMISAALAERARYVVARRRQLYAVAAFETVSLVVMMIMLAADVPGLGYPQAVMVLLASVWFAIAAVSVSGGVIRLPPGLRLRAVDDRA